MKGRKRRKILSAAGFIERPYTKAILSSVLVGVHDQEDLPIVLPNLVLRLYSILGLIIDYIAWSSIHPRAIKYLPKLDNLLTDH
jgi:hypothetical protein